jgi:hypothetical protein
MNLSQFFEHWSIIENPFRGEEARHDAVFARMVMRRTGPTPPVASGTLSPVAASPAPAANGSATGAAHSDFEKILGELDRPSSAIVFGEKGSGKTAIRLQIADRLAAHNAARPQNKVLVVAYDDLNTMLDRLHQRVSGASAGSAGSGKDVLASLQKIRLVDHLDAILSIAVTALVDALLRPTGATAAVGNGPILELGPEPAKSARRLDTTTRRDLLLLQAIYDGSDQPTVRTRRLRRALRLVRPAGPVLLDALAAWGWIPLLVLAIWVVVAATPEARKSTVLGVVALVVVGLYVVLVLKRLVYDTLRRRALGRRIRKQIRVGGRSDDSYAASLKQLDAVDRQPRLLPLTDSDDQRYAMLGRLRRVLRGFGYSGILIVVDRVDEPTLVSGDPDRMRAIIWPMLNNKFLQQEGLGVKMLLPIELRHLLFKESSNFFQEARLDKQNLVERLSWTGAMLYDLCDARLKACRPPSTAPIALLDLFAEDVTRKDLVDALDQMHQPRDAFKFLYACILEHCSNVTGEENEYRIPRLVLETVRKQQSDRVQQLYRGIRPA